MSRAIGVKRAFAGAFVGFAALAALTMLSDAPVHAQSNDPMLEGRLSNIERQLNQLQGQVSSGGAAPIASSGESSGGNEAELMQRIVTIEESLRTLTGQVEQLGYQQQQLQARLEKLEAGGGAMSAPNAAPVAPGATPGTSGSAAPALGAPGSQTLGSLSTPSGAAPVVGDEDSQFAAAVDVLYRGDYAGGQQALQSFVDQHPKSKKTGEAYYWLGESQLAQKAYREAAEAFLQVVQNYPKDAKAPQSLVKLGVTLIAAGEKKEGCNQLKSVKEVFPKANQSVIDMASRERTKAGC